jgi:NAD(P)H-nitrite reductase large subunit
MESVIIGSGVAGIAAIEAIRSVDSAGEITLIGSDPHGYYSRPGLAYYLTGEIPDKVLIWKRPEDFQNLGVRPILGTVKRILRAEQHVELEGREYVHYDRLLLAVGASAIPLDVPGSRLDGVFKLDHLSDARQIVKNARRGKIAVVVGGGLTGLELVEGLVARGMHVHYVLREDRFWSHVLDFQESKIIEQRLMQEGVQLHHHAEIAEIHGDQNRVCSVRLKNNTSLRCDMLAYAIGVRPQTHLAKQAALEVDRGILVDEYMQTNDPNIFAAGDVAQVYDPLLKRSVIESLWTPSREQGTTAGLNMAGRRKMYTKSAALNVTRLAGLTTTIIGTVGQCPDPDPVGIVRGDSETWHELPDGIVAQSGFDVNHVRVMVGQQTLLGAVVIGNQTLSNPLQKIISNKVNISSIRQDLLHPQANIAEVLVRFWANYDGHKLKVEQRTIPGNLHPSLSEMSAAQLQMQKTIPRV